MSARAAEPMEVPPATASSCSPGPRCIFALHGVGAHAGGVAGSQMGGGALDPARGGVGIGAEHALDVYRESAPSPMPSAP